MARSWWWAEIAWPGRPPPPSATTQATRCWISSITCQYSYAMPYRRYVRLLPGLSFPPLRRRLDRDLRAISQTHVHNTTYAVGYFLPSAALRPRSGAAVLDFLLVFGFLRGAQKTEHRGWEVPFLGSGVDIVLKHQLQSSK